MELMIHLPKNVSYTPLSLKNFEGYEDDNDFLQDPSQIRDDLPQPYRMINRIVEDLYGDTWEIIKDKEEKDVVSRTKLHPPVIDGGVLCDIHGNRALCMTSSSDGSYIFVGVKDGIVAINANYNELVTFWDEPDLELTNIESVMMIPDVHVLSTIDDLGVARLYAFHHERFLSLKCFVDADSTMKVLTTKCECSNNADYLALAQEYPTSSECCLDIYKLPVEVWTKEFEALTSQISKQKSQLEHEGGDATLMSQFEQPTNAATITKSCTTNASKVTQITTIHPTHPALVAIEKGFKFSPPTLIMKVKPPPNVTTCPTNNIASLCKAVDPGDVIGQGVNHVFTQHFVEQEKQVFNYIHRDLLEFLPPVEDRSSSQPTFHFINQGRMTVTIDPTVPQDHPSSVFVWWTNSRFLYHYSLVKFPAKDFEQKADMIIPLSRPIVCSTITPCTSLIAVGLKHGLIVLWDRYAGIEKGIVDLGHECTIDSLHFINPGIRTLSDTVLDPSLPTQVFLLVLTNKSHLRLASFGPEAGRIEVVYLSDSLKDVNAHTITHLLPLPSLPNIILRVERNGVMYLQDMVNQSLLAEISLPPTYEMPSPWQPEVAFGEGGQMLYVKGVLSMKASHHMSTEATRETTSADDPYTTTATALPSDTQIQLSRDTTCSSPLSADPIGSSHDMHHDNDPYRVFMFELSAVPLLDNNWANRPSLKSYTTHYTAKERADMFMKRRLSEQGARKDRMQVRWGQFKQDLISRAVSVDVNILKQSFQSRNSQMTDFIPRNGIQSRK